MGGKIRGTGERRREKENRLSLLTEASISLQSPSPFSFLLFAL
jgi:hypothetical protein